MHAYDRLFIGGAWVSAAAADVIDVVSPHNEQVMGNAPSATAEDVDSAVMASASGVRRGSVATSGAAPPRRISFGVGASLRAARR